MSERRGTYRLGRSDVSHSYAEEEPKLLGFDCSEGDWFTSEKEFFRALEDFGKHNLESHVGSISVHIQYVYAEPGRRRR